MLSRSLWQATLRDESHFFHHQMIVKGIDGVEMPLGALENSATGLFQWRWRICRKVVDNNNLVHREAYACLHSLMIDDVAGPFSFLDVTCGDASATVNALKETQVAHYYGIDLSRCALDIVGQSLRLLDCPFTLYESDFVQALKDWCDPVRVVWIGLSLHHLSTPEKLNVMRDVRRIVCGQRVHPAGSPEFCS